VLNFFAIESLSLPVEEASFYLLYDFVGDSFLQKYFLCYGSHIAYYEFISFVSLYLFSFNSF